VRPLGTSTQSRHLIQVRLIINEYSTEEDRQMLVDAFDQGMNEGLVIHHYANPH